MALSEFEVIVGGLTSVPVVVLIFFLIEKTYGSKIYVIKPGKASTASKSASSKPAATKPAAANPTVLKRKDGSTVPVQPSSAKNGSAN